LNKPYRRQTNRIRINEQIRAPELRVVGSEGENLGVLKTEEAQKKAKDMGMDLIEISPSAKPPIAKITDYGKFQYDQKKKKSAQKAKTHNVEVKSIQIKVATGEHDLNLKASRAGEWLKEGHRVKVELYLKGRSKYMERKFLEERLERVLKLIPENYNIAENIKKNPKGLYLIIEKSKGKPKTDDKNKEHENK